MCVKSFLNPYYSDTAKNYESFFLYEFLFYGTLVVKNKEECRLKSDELRMPVLLTISFAELLFVLFSRTELNVQLSISDHLLSFVRLLTQYIFQLFLNNCQVSFI